MADESTEVQIDETPQPSSKSGTIKLIIAGVVIIILAAGISFGVAMFAAKSFSHTEVQKGDGYGKVKSESLGTTYDAGEYITNLASEDGNRFVKLKVVFAFQDTNVQTELVNKLPEIQHTINSTLRQQSPASLSRPNAMEKLANLIKKNVNGLLINGNITDVYFTSFVVQ